MSANIVLVQGRISSDPKTINLDKETSMVTFDLAHNERWKQNNETQEKSHFFKVKAFGEVAKLILRYWKKGQVFTANGKLTMDTWQTEEGSKRSMVSIIVKQLSFEDLPKNDLVIDESDKTG